VYAIGQARKNVYTSVVGSAWLNHQTPPLLKGTITRIVTHPSSAPSTLMTAWLLGGYPAQVLYTTDGGSNWTDITGDLPTRDANFGPTDIVIDPVTTWLYLATTSGVYKTTNNGNNWTLWSSRLPGGGTQAVMTLRTVDQRSAGGNFNVYAGIWGSGIWLRNGAEN